MLLKRFDPPAFMTDLDAIPGALDAWHAFLSMTFDWAVDQQSGLVRPAEGQARGHVQFFNPATLDPGEAPVEQPVTWNAFPKELLVRFGRRRALVEADRLWPWEAYRDPEYDPARPGLRYASHPTAWYRPHNEYCEWRVERDAATGAIRRVTFTSEPPEYWQALFGDDIALDEDRIARFPGDRKLALKLYRELVGPAVELEDLLLAEDTPDAKRGDYDIYNKWNTTHGIVHLCAPPNSLVAEVKLGADATVRYGDALGRPVTGPDALVCGAGYGGTDRNSDPTIGATVNALARAGALVTLANPVGLYMDHIDLSGWEPPSGVQPEDCVRILRGKPGYIERMVVEMPAGTPYTLDDLSIGGEPVRTGGQLAECITVKLVGAAARLGKISNGFTPAACRCCVDPTDATRLRRPIGWSQPTPPGFADAFGAERPRQQQVVAAAAARFATKDHTVRRKPLHSRSDVL